MMPDPERGRGIGFPFELVVRCKLKKRERCFDPGGFSVTKWIGRLILPLLSWSVLVVVAVAQPRAMLCLAEKDNEALYLGSATCSVPSGWRFPS